MHRTHRPVLLLLCAAALLTACDKNAVQDIAAPLDQGQALIRFFNFGVGAPGVNFYANDMKVTAIGSATGQEAVTGVTYGGVGAGGFYTTVAPGQYTLTGRIAATIDKDLPISNLPAALAAGKAYSFYQSGIYNTAGKTVESFIVEDPIPATFDYSVAHVRFVHAISNADAMTLYLTPRTEGASAIAVGAVVPYKSAGAFTPVPVGAYDLATRYTGATTNAITRVNLSFAAGRVYTITARGNITVASTVLLDNTANR
ncbi:hypothetical protein BH23GEM9_BH23GEM9_08060 [soil metagenome]